MLFSRLYFPVILYSYSFACLPEVFNTLFVNFISSEESSTQNNKMFTKSRNLFVVVRLFRNSPFTNSFVTSDVLKTFVPHICIRVIGKGWFCHFFQVVGCLKSSNCKLAFSWLQMSGAQTFQKFDKTAWNWKLGSL